MKKYFLVLGLALFVLACGPGSKEPSASQLFKAGESHFKNQEYDQAIDCFQKVTQLEPKSAAAYNMLGMAYRFKANQLGQPELRIKEMAAFQKAIDIDPKYWVAMINLGASYYNAGDHAKAVPLFEKALEINPQHPEKAQLEKMIAEGRGQ
ncbi:MAG: tetratricopeptide repeat protein [Desulfobacca sp.]|nr:tetratricopeptide repeat protein [Desulfobacca sp.]